MLTWLTSRRQHQKTAQKLYGRIVAQARNPWFYSHLGVPDTLEGRFEMLVLHMYLVLDRLRTSESCAPLAQALVDDFFEDLDVIHRELGVSDLKVPKRMYRTAGVFYARLDDYARAFADEDTGAIDAAIKACVGSEAGTPADVAALRDYAIAVQQALEAQDGASLARADVTFQVPGRTDQVEVS